MQAHRVVTYVQLPLDMQELYLNDLQAWVMDACRNASGQTRAANLLDALYHPTRSTTGLARWNAIGPHAALRAAYRLSNEAVSILLLAAAPQLWGGLAHIYAEVSPAGHGHADVRLLRKLLGNDIDLGRELVSDAPLVAFGLVTRHSSGTITPSRDVIRRLAGA